MQILAIDPGPKKSAWASYMSQLRPPVVGLGLEPNEDVRLMLRAAIEELKPEWMLAIEGVHCYGKVGNEITETCEWTGRFIEAWGGPYTKIPRSRVRAACAKALDGTPEGYGVSANTVTDKEVRLWMIQRFGKVGTMKNPGPMYGFKRDLWAALAVAVTCAEGSPA